MKIKSKITQMVLVLVPMMALAETAKVGDVTWSYDVSNGKAMVTGANPASGALEIPSVLNGYAVTSIGAMAFYDCSGLTSVTIPSSVTSIGGIAFFGCRGLTSVTIPEGVTSIGGDTFAYCSGLTSVTIPSSVTSIEYAFRECSGLKAFLVDVNNPSYSSRNGLLCSKDGKMLINGVNGDVTIPSGVTNIGNYAFFCYTGLTSVTIPSSVTSIGEGAFQSCGGMTSVTIPSSVTSIGGCAFSGCSALKLVTIPDGVTSIGGGAFSCCSRLTAVIIPPSVTSIGEGAFCYCPSLLRVYYQGNAPEYKTYEYEDEDYEEPAGLYDGSSAALISFVREGTTGWWRRIMPGWTDQGDLPDSWQGRSIAYGEAMMLDGVAWEFVSKNGKARLRSLTPAGGLDSSNVTIPAEVNGMKVVEVGDGAFSELDEITSVVVPASVRTIGSRAFYGCDGLEEVTFLGDAPYVYDDAFSGTKSSLKFTVPQGSIGWSDNALAGLPGAWMGRAIQYAGGGHDAGGNAASLGTVMVSNVVVHYILNSVQPQFAISPSQDMGFVNIITEVKSTGVASIPMSWAMNYPNFVSKFGSDFTAALGKPTGKTGTGGTPMLVWQDYVAGTDPTDEKDVFRASIAIVDGKVTISYSPELDDARKAMRKYTIWGKTSLMDTTWAEVQEGHEAEYNFFKVSVEMR